MPRVKPASEPQEKPKLRIAERRRFKLAELRPAEYNPREITPDEQEDLRAGMREFGVVQDLVINVHPGREGVIVGGFQRFRIMREDGIEEVDAATVDLPIDRERELNIRLNANGGRFSPVLLVEFGFKADELSSWGFRPEELESFDKAVQSMAASNPQAPGAFQPVGPGLPTQHRCPSCGYEWSGKSKTGEPNG